MKQYLDSDIMEAGEGLPLSHLAYVLATAYGETGGRMKPVEENLRYTSPNRVEDVFSHRRRKGIPGHKLVRDPVKLANTVYDGVLGNDSPGDGWTYRGRGYVQITGKDNYRRMSQLVGIDLVKEPDRALSPKVSAKILVEGMRRGMFTGESLFDHLPTDGRAWRMGFVKARRIVNGSFEAEKYADLAMKFQHVLETERRSTPSSFMARLMRALGWG